MQALSVHLLNIFLANLHVKLRCIRCEIFRGSIFFSQNVGYETDISLKRQITFAEAFFSPFQTIIQKLAVFHPLYVNVTRIP